MSDKRAYVVDTNILIDAVLFKNSYGRRAFDLVRKQNRIVLSGAIFSELVEVLYRPRLRAYVSEDERRLFLTKLGDDVEFIEPTQTICVCRDPKDDKFLELAVAVNAEAIITARRRPHRTRSLLGHPNF